MAHLIGITGGIGSGKSVVSRVLRCRGREVYDCDMRAKMLMEQCAELKLNLRRRFGDDCLLEDGKINRAYLARCVFGDESHRLWLNARVHSMVRDDIASLLSDMREEGVMYVESAILKSSGLDRMCNEIWLVDAPVELRLQRVVERDGADRESAMLRMKAQRNEFENFSVPVHLIDNGGTESVISQIDNLLERLS